MTFKKGEVCPACHIGIIEEKEPHGKWTHILGCTVCPTEMRAKGCTIVGIGVKDE